MFSKDSDADLLPLKKTSVNVDVAGVMANVSLTQVYRNEGRDTLEAVYIFPASTRAAVQAMSMSIGDRTIVAKIAERDQAKKEYDKALSDGRTASLLAQVRPNVFQMSVGNILSGDEIRVELSYSELLVPENGQYEFVYPTVVGPRYSSGTHKELPGQVDWIVNPYLRLKQLGLKTFALSAHIRSAVSISNAYSPSHDLAVEFESPTEVFIEFQESPEAGNRDFVVRYKLAGDSMEQGLLLYPGEDESFFLLMMEPPERVEAREIVDREYIFIIDVSGSMNGFPLETSKSLMHELLDDLRPRDYFNLILFAGGAAELSSNSVPASKRNILDALRLIDLQQGGGGTNLLSAMENAFNLPRHKNTARVLVLLTDGYVSVEKESFALVRSKLGEASLFVFGIGHSVNRFLIEGLSRAGMGEPFIVTSESESRQKAELLRNYI